jgi:hypothetical protein
VTRDKAIALIEARVCKDGPLLIGMPSQCWNWIGCRTPKGYGVVNPTPDMRYPAHRLAYMTYVGPLLEKEQVCHHCDNPSCVNPEHLFSGTTQDNTADMVQKGRNSRGESRPASKLNANKVAEIRNRHGLGEGIRALAREFGVSQRAIQYVVRRIYWKDVA